MKQIRSFVLLFSVHSILLFAAWDSPVQGSSEGLRKWTDKDGRSVEAVFVRVEAGNVYLKLPDGRILPFPFERLSEADKEAARRLYRTNPPGLSAQIDAYVNQKLAAEKITPNPPTSDEQFVRRAYLEITGTIPTFNEALDFLESSEPDKRRRLIDRLLDSEGFTSHSFNWYADMLRLVSRTNDFYIFEHYNQWVKDSIRENMPYDRFVEEMLTAKGGMWEDGAAGYFLRDRGMPLGNLATTVSVFLGTEITCAECHDHPFEEWTQMDFYSLAGFLGQRQDRPSGKSYSEQFSRQTARIEAEQRLKDPALGADGFNQPFRQLIAANQNLVWDNPERKFTLPHDYKYDDGKPGEPVSPRTLFGKEVDLSAYESPRMAFADWLTSRENPTFAKTAANRLWKRAFGIGQIEPLDNIRDGNHAQNPELFFFLEQSFKDLDFNVKEFLRAIYYSEAWQRRATLEGPTLAEIDGNGYHFPGPVLKRMTSQQLWDSFLTLTVPDPLRHRRNVADELEALFSFEIEKVTGEESISRIASLNDLVMRTVSHSAPYASVWASDSTVTDSSDGALVKYAGSYLARASDLAHPAPASHFLRAWGQGDRALVDGSSENGSIPQILTMINGPFTQMLVKPDSLIFKNTGSERGTGDKMEKIFLSILSRQPQGKEKAICSKAIRNDDEGYGDLIWALVNTQEFLFIR